MKLVMNCVMLALFFTKMVAGEATGENMKNDDVQQTQNGK